MIDSALFATESKAWDARLSDLRKYIHTLRKATNLSAQEKQARIDRAQMVADYVAARVQGDAQMAAALREGEPKERKTA
jgi:hypothetical protein